MIVKNCKIEMSDLSEMIMKENDVLSGCIIDMYSTFKDVDAVSIIGKNNKIMNCIVRFHEPHIFKRIWYKIKGFFTGKAPRYGGSAINICDWNNSPEENTK